MWGKTFREFWRCIHDHTYVIKIGRRAAHDHAYCPFIVQFLSLEHIPQDLRWGTGTVAFTREKWGGYILSGPPLPLGWMRPPHLSPFYPFRVFSLNVWYIFIHCYNTRNTMGPMLGIIKIKRNICALMDNNNVQQLGTITQIVGT